MKIHSPYDDNDLLKVYTRIRNGHPVISHRGACSLDYLTDLNSQIFPFQANEFVLIIYGYDRLVNVPIRINKIQNY
ncbi:hypothetical protein DERP_014378 [Dermatophagoides pteronyssinus]|uniref:Uncharacterized protein n=1 Tax=Dermatophagoides pteronyssinus TaxID=6956 RepID=A0ABQ8J5U2_DERPT|nr:hypothetical protein DERP_014378 [Dermatophagoides pteronyssinus]